VDVQFSFSFIDMLHINFIWSSLDGMGWDEKG